jgi:hypothetical protein
MGNILIKFVNFIIDKIDLLLSLILSILPDSPFSSINVEFLTPYLANINWFIPVGRIVAMLAVWSSAVLIYYLYSVIMRFTNLVD